MKIPFFIFTSVLTIFVVAEGESLMINSSLILANMTQDMTHYSGNPAWVTRYNEALWLSESRQYNKAKMLLAPLLNDTSIPQKADIAELYGDLLYHSSGSLDDTIHMYERSLSFHTTPRVSEKIAYLKQVRDTKTASGNIEKSPGESKKTSSGSQEREAKKRELQKISTEREKYLGNSMSSQAGMRTELQHLIDSVQSGSLTVMQDW